RHAVPTQRSFATRPRCRRNSATSATWSTARETWSTAWRLRCRPRCWFSTRRRRSPTRSARHALARAAITTTGRCRAGSTARGSSRGRRRRPERIRLASSGGHRHGGCAGQGDTAADVRQRLVDLVDEDQAQVAGLELVERGVDCEELAADLLHARRARRAGQALPQQREYFAVAAAALALVFVEDHLVERLAENLGLAPDVLVAPVAGAADDHEAAVCGHRFDGARERRDGVGIVAVVGDHGRA